MSYSGDLSKQTDATNRKKSLTHNKIKNAETASRERRRLWPVDREVPTAVMVANEFVRHGLTSFLKDTQFRIMASAATLNEMNDVMDAQSTPALIIMAFDDAPSADAVRALRTAYADAKLVLLGRPNAPGSLPEDVCLTGETVLDRDINQKTLIAALTVVMSSPHLSSRELSVLQALATGASNKAIGRRYDMAEGKVNYLVKNILRKLQMPNRTHAAVWACEHGIYG